MERSKELAVLSREHHVALELALRLQRATDTDAGTVTGATLDFWREGRKHFRLEEELLLPAFARHAGADDPDIVRVLVDHVDIRCRITDLEDRRTRRCCSAQRSRRALRDHVRYEERTLFGRIEQTLDTAELAALGSALHASGAEHQPPRA